MKAPTHWFCEQKVADRLGITRDEFRIVRGQILKKNRDWQKHGRAIVLSEAALERLLASLRLTNETAATLKVQDFVDCCEAPLVSTANEVPLALPAPPPQILELIVFNACVNSRLVNALDPENAKKMVRVRVRDNSNFRKGMKLKAKAIAGVPGYYELQGRCPRYGGRY